MVGYFYTQISEKQNSTSQTLTLIDESEVCFRAKNITRIIKELDPKRHLAMIE